MFHYQHQTLYAESVPLAEIAQAVGTPCYVYSQALLTRAWQDFVAGFQHQSHLVCYAVKANANLSVLQTFAGLGAGFDIVSGGELQRVLWAGGDAKKVVFSGVGKSATELEQALRAGILCFNVESSAELDRLHGIAQRLNIVAPIALRVNPDVSAQTHPYIATGLKDNKFGIPYDEALALYRYAHSLPFVSVQGIACHIGSQITSLSPFVDALQRIMALLDSLEQAGIAITHVDVGGGIGIRYQDETPPSFENYAQALLGALRKRPCTLLLAPGRALVGNAGVLLTRVEYLKHTPDKHFAIVDAGMNDLLRPALYDAYHAIQPIQSRDGQILEYDVVGPVCESGDFLGKDRRLCLETGDVLAVMSAGAYGMSMASHYNTRPLPAEVMVTGDSYRLIRPRDTLEQLCAGERASLSQ